MYAQDVPRIKAYAGASPDNLANVITFVLLSIRVQFTRVATAMRDVRREGRDSAFLWGFKQEGFDYVQAHKESIHSALCGAPYPTTVEAVDYLASEVCGLGIVKAAFVAQMLGHNVACFDSRNLDSLEWGGRPFREFKRRNGVCVIKAETRQRHIAAYVQMTIETGGAAHWWDHWCNGIAPQFGGDGDRVSRLHWQIIEGTNK